MILLANFILSSYSKVSEDFSDSLQHIIFSEIFNAGMSYKISSASGKNEFSIGVFIDLSEAFDTINHTILISRLIKILWDRWSSTRLVQTLSP